jgi:hypothetical protein
LCQDIDGDGDQGNIGHGVLEDEGKKLDLTSEEAVQVELWATRLKAVEEDIKRTREEEYKVGVCSAPPFLPLRPCSLRYKRGV